MLSWEQRAATRGRTVVFGACETTRRMVRAVITCSRPDGRDAGGDVGPGACCELNAVTRGCSKIRYRFRGSPAACCVTQEFIMNDTAARKADLRYMLSQRRREIQDEVQSRIRDGRSGRPKEVRDDLEHSDADAQRDLEFALLQMRAEAVARIDAALRRLDAGKYGFCFACEGEISERRLRALPFAGRCQACEERREHEQGQARQLAQRRGSSLRSSRMGSVRERDHRCGDRSSMRPAHHTRPKDVCRIEQPSCIPGSIIRERKSPCSCTSSNALALFHDRLAGRRPSSQSAVVIKRLHPWGPC